MNKEYKRREGETRSEFRVRVTVDMLTTAILATEMAHGAVKAEQVRVVLQEALSCIHEMRQEARKSYERMLDANLLLLEEKLRLAWELDQQEGTMP